MTKEEYGNFVLRYKGCGACFPMYHTLSRFEKMWFTAIQKDVANLEKENAELQQKWLNESYEKAKLVEKWKHNGEAIIQECKDIEGANAYYKHQLTKAKELLNMFLRLHYNPIVDECTLYNKVEQFLKEE